MTEKSFWARLLSVTLAPFLIEAQRVWYHSNLFRTTPVRGTTPERSARPISRATSAKKKVHSKGWETGLSPSH
jgi:hypothetical protein